MQIAAIKRNSFVDCPKGVCTTIFTQGCNLACPFCYNKELIDTGTLGLIAEDEALEIIRQDKDISKWVCLTGGEPLIHNDLSSFIREIGKLDVKVKLDTNGFSPTRLDWVLKMTECVEYVAVDVKGTMEGLSNHTPWFATLDILEEYNIEKELRITMDGNINFPTENGWRSLFAYLATVYPQFPIIGQHYKPQGKAVGRRITQEETNRILEIAEQHGANFTIREQE